MFFTLAAIHTMRPDLAFEIQAMAMADQELRFRMTRMHPKFQGMSLAEVHEWQDIDHQNTLRMKQIVAEVGWPDANLVGKDASSDAWLLVQHADQDPPFQRKCLDLLRPKLAGGSVRKQDYAYLFDRVALAEGHYQRYGTQYAIENGKFTMKPTEDPKNLDKRRKSMGMMPIKDYEKLLREAYK